MLTGILIGLVTGVGLSAGVAVWVARMPSPFQNRAVDTAGPADAPRSPGAPGVSAPPSRAAGADPAADAAGAGAAGPAGAAPAAQPATSAAAASSTASASTPTGTTGAGTIPGAPAREGATNNAAAASSLAVSKTLSAGNTWLQVGAFTTEEDAQKQVESVALLTGVRASVQPLQQSDKTLYRVRLGPFVQKTDYAELSDTLKSNGISAAVIHTNGQ